MKSKVQVFVAANMNYQCKWETHTTNMPTLCWDIVALFCVSFLNFGSSYKPNKTNSISLYHRILSDSAQM